MNKSGVVIQEQHGYVVVNIYSDLHSQFLANLKHEVLGFCKNKAIKGVVLDMSGINIIDMEDFKGIKKIVLSVKLMGFPCILSGLSVGIVAYLVLQDCDFSGIKAFRNLDQAMNYLNKKYVQ